MTFNIVGLLIGILIAIAGIYYLIKETDDKESRRIYGITTAVGAVIMVVMIVKILMF